MPRWLLSFTAHGPLLRPDLGHGRSEPSAIRAGKELGEATWPRPAEDRKRVGESAEIAVASWSTTGRTCPLDREDDLDG